MSDTTRHAALVLLLGIAALVVGAMLDGVVPPPAPLAWVGGR